MSIFGTIAGIAGKITEPLFSIIDQKVKDKDLAAQLKREAEQSVIKHVEVLQAEITKRHELDMTSDSWLSKNVRPMTLIFLLAMFVFISVFDGNIRGFTINEQYIPVYEFLLGLAFTFYFGSRGFEKGMKIYTKGKENEKSI